MKKFLRKMMMRGSSNFSQPQSTISVLFDYNSIPDRYIAADDLAAYDEPLVRTALIHLASDLEEEKQLREVCGAALGEIYWRNQIHDLTFLEQLTVEAKAAFEEEYHGAMKITPNGSEFENSG